MTSKKRSAKRSSGDGRTGGLFAAVSALESADARASRNRLAESAASASRSRAARAQSDLGAGLVECRVLLQRAVASSSTTTTTDSEEGDGSVGGAKRRRLNEEETTEAGAAADRLLAKLLEARNRLCLPRDEGGEDPDYSALVKSETKNEGASDDSDGDGDSSSGDDDGSGGPRPTKLHDALQSEYDVCRSSWRETLNRRHHDLRLHAGLTARTKFRAVDRTFWEQVEATVAHDRLMQGAHEAGDDAEGGEGDDGAGEDGPPRTSAAGTAASSSSLSVFDDSKVYRQLLRDFVALGASSAGGGRGGAAGAAADAAAERLRRAARKKKGGPSKDVDRKASKGRKIRYAVNPKLTNFTFPVARPMPAISDDDWFKSLFGGAGRRSK